MANTISSYFENAQLSLAAYAINLTPGMAPADYIFALGEAGMSTAQATKFSDTYAILAPTYTQFLTGFSATLFQKSGTTEKFLAIRGTEPGSPLDWLSDLALFAGLLGPVITPQYDALKNYYQQLLTDGKLTSTEAITVSGHSLGGFLAQLFAVDYTNVVTHAYTYNAPGIGGFVSQLGELFGITDANVSGANITNLQATGPSATAGWGTLLGDVKAIYTEDQAPNYAANHYIKYLTDSLAVYNLFATLDPTLNTNPTTSIPKLTGILKATASQDAKTLETTLADLITLFQRDYQNGSTIAFDTPGPTDNREDFYTKLIALETYLKGSALNTSSDTTPSYSLTVKSLVGSDASSLTTSASVATDLATRYALYKLNAFTVNGTGLYETINSDNSLSLYDSAARSGALTEEYLKDRAAFLYNKIIAGIKNNESNGKDWAKYSGTPQHFQDGTGPLAYHLYLGPDASVVGQSTQNISNILFGEWFDNTGATALTGGDQGDKLYGLDGNDTLTGGKGNDYLEGGQGTDTYNFTTAHGLDILLDTDHQGQIQYDGTPLTGGPRALQNNNVYQSPDGNFTYTLIDAGANDTLIITTPGGEIQVKDFQAGDLGITLPDAPPPTFNSTFDGTVNHDADVSDTGVPLGVSGGTALDSNWTGYAPLGSLIYHSSTDVGGMYFISRAGQPYPENTIFEALYGNEGDDFLLGNPGAENFTIDAGAGNDWIISDYNDKFSAFQGSTTYTPGQGTTVYAGAGHDAVQGGFRHDWIDANTGHDQVTGLEGRDYINGGSGNDWLAGNRDDDILIGGPDTASSESDHDMLLGGSGSDYLYGGAGDDTLYGDASGGFSRRVVDVGNGALYLMGWNGETRTHLIPDFVGASSTIALLADAPLYEDGGYPASGYTPSTLSEDYLDGGIGDDKLFGGVGNDILDGGTDNDKLYGEAGDDWLLGGDGNDKLWGDLDNAVFNQDQQIAETHGTLSLFNREYVTETLAEGHDILEGGDGDDELRGGGGNDTLRGGIGTDILVGGAGADTLDGGKGNDTIYRDASDTLVFRTGDGQDQVTYGDGGFLQFEGLTIDQFQISKVTGTDGWQYLVLTNGGDSVSLQGGFLAANQTFELGGVTLNQQQLMTFAPAVSLAGTANADTIYGSNQSDSLYGYGGYPLDPDGSDALYGQGGDDKLYGFNGNDTLYGGEGNDTLYAHWGDDLLDGGTGNDSLQGGEGNDTYRFGRTSAQDWLRETDDNGTTTDTDTVQLEAGILPGDVTLYRDGNDLLLALDQSPTQLRVSDHFTSAINNNFYKIERIAFADGTVWGEADIAARVPATAVDAFTGTTGNDTFIVDNTQDTITEQSNQGMDIIQSSVSYTLPTNVENLTLTGYFNLNVTGNELDNVITGNNGNNVLDGMDGADTLIGGPGDDIYRSGAIIENSDEGIDWVETRSSVTLAANVEHARFIGTDFPYLGITFIGNNLDNILIGPTYLGTSFDGGLGADTMIGGDSNDTYTVDNPADHITDSSGTETVRSSISYVLPTGIENLVLLGSSPISGTGNASWNTLDGSQNSAANVLTGGAGNDTYLLGVGDTMVENINQGTDEVKIVSGPVQTYTLDTYPNVENLRLDNAILGGNLTGDGANNSLIGNLYGNILTGGGGDDLLGGNGGSDVFDGGVGRDTLQGGTGADTYLFGRGTEQDKVNDNGGASGSTDTIQYAADVSPSDILVGRLGDDLFLAVKSTPDLVRVSNHFFSSASYNYSVEQIKFTADGTIWDKAAIAVRVSSNLPTTDSDLIIGTNGGNDTLDGGAGADSLVGEYGNDTYIVDNVGDAVTENPNEGTDTVQSSITYTLGSNVENLTLTGTNAINGTGNALNNVITGNNKGNYLYGRAGNDTLIGGATDGSFGIDWLDGEDGDDTLTAGTKNLSFLYGGAGNDILTAGNGGSNFLYGGDGNDHLIGSASYNQLDGGAGNDLMEGMSGDDIYTVDSAGDLVVELVNEGTDTVQSSITHTLGANVENLTLTGTTAINATGNALNNTLTGSANNAANVLTGLSGNDTYYVGTGDTVIENVNEGTDTVQSMVTHTLGANVENLTLTGSSAINGTGNELANILTGNSSNNTLNGGAGNDSLTGNAGNDTLNGGTGADAMAGGTGNDIYVVDDALDTINENLNEGADTVQSGITYTLGANLENLTLTGSTAINGTGNDLDNIVTGNTADNVLDGGVGDDTLYGGLGDDIYIIRPNDGGDIIEDVSGNDQVQFQTGINPSDIRALRYGDQGPFQGDNLMLSFNNLGYFGQIVFPNWYLGEKIELFTFAGGLQMTEAELLAPKYSITYDPDLGYGVCISGPEGYLCTAGGGDGMISGTEGDDILKGGAIAINGYGGNDSLFGDVGNDTLHGGAGDDKLAGDYGDDLLDGGLGADTLYGNQGDDTYVVDDAGDVVTELANEGTDTVQSSIAYILGSNVENLTLTGSAAINGTGNEHDNIITGNDQNNWLYGQGGNDSLHAGGGPDWLFGGAGNDVLVGGAPAAGVWNGDWLYGEAGDDILIGGTKSLNFLDGGEGNDSLTTTGGTYNTLSGGGGNDALTGSIANDYLNGGTGTDTMAGGTGNDTYVVDNVGDSVIENTNEGTDTVRSSITCILGSNVENLTLTGTAAINGTGNALNNVITGNHAGNWLRGGAGNDTLYALGGADWLYGGDGNDTLMGGTPAAGTWNGDWLYGDNGDDVLIGGSKNLNYLDGGAGHDTLTAGSGAYNTLLGGTGNDTLTGAGGADYLDGGLGNDTLNGGVGNDTYRFSSSYGQDIITDNDATIGNTDTVSAGVNPLNLVFSQSGNNLLMNLHGTTDTLTIASWYNGSANQTELFRASDNSTLANSQIDQLIQAMAQFTANNGGITWDQAIDQNPNEVQAVLAAYWQPSSG